MAGNGGDLETVQNDHQPTVIRIGCNDLQPQCILFVGANIMGMQIIITDTEFGATISLLSGDLKWSQTYSSWEKALDAALSLNLMSQEIYREALSLPPAFPYCGEADVVDHQLAAAGFTYPQYLAA
jgi:hypothetical protein